MIEHTDPITGRYTVNGIGPDDQVRNARTGQTGTVTFASLAHDVHVVPDDAPIDASGYARAEIWRLADVEKVEADAAMTARRPLMICPNCDEETDGEYVHTGCLPEYEAWLAAQADGDVATLAAQSQERSQIIARRQALRIITRPVRRD